MTPLTCGIKNKNKNKLKKTLDKVNRLVITRVRWKIGKMGQKLQAYSYKINKLTILYCIFEKLLEV